MRPSSVFSMCQKAFIIEMTVENYKDAACEMETLM
jgi:hypothetical protein